MDIIIGNDGALSFDFSFDIIIALLIIAIPSFFLSRWILGRKARPDKPKMLYIVIATILLTIIIYILTAIIVYYIIIKYYIT
ncbi:heme/copper-type cytochrome/quinol oxidase subunit 2 [Dysgonomonas sp. PFB1-18]|uniref:hypothetical protein n=1 Tax=unclassified Dysgonomonas TaxID=2630389 RepID=UPI0024741359|nr:MULTISPECIES: hypothetical protein [unclassified Dysgonomonas]MDH6307651.1 heme/copper-type cytochrome/quinol oxidase subunit 2 [Dysgonomonas sp. PF1-14]MDH6337569.1 heme/copper-type cytochrome/quinol oxidase subunit 2 [Dysgonomonas sp. PF1-16]MDH6378793.1 heme/copper-type cytochrome/quinol oxidase subunit 2 [Dysgonomonas sp. PFB1-18]MDH6399211.1 heme/copper-type cytochrome/quinol oxidase subunit 2 [Dysgonomonas sp. PF1-23]